MRDLEFRAWVECDEHGDRFVKAEEIKFFPNVIYVYDRGVGYEYQIHPRNLAQFTGLNDKNGVKIFEGDIVKWGHIKGYEEYLPRIAIVDMTVDLSFVTVNLGDNNHKFRYGSFLYARCIDKAMEVIGNIHENPELLEK